MTRFALTLEFDGGPFMGLQRQPQGLTVQQANPLANLKVRDGALASLVTDEIAPLLMLPIGLALRQVA